MGSGQWAVVSKQWAVVSKQWSVGSRQWAVSSIFCSLLTAHCFLPAEKFWKSFHYYRSWSVVRPMILENAGNAGIVSNEIAPKGRSIVVAPSGYRIVVAPRGQDNDSQG